MKLILKLLLTLALYEELSKEITYEIICRMQAEDMVDQPKDYEE
ncbi:transcriptional activator RinB [Staphylococcus hsinchuensis]|uniref:Transcriptional regulator n=1 Tax=Staphylococcus hsinchuensis TaxID=3051183 RepID=A0ABZ3E9P6_9STAP